MEPTWGLLNRLLCVLQPFEELRKGDSLASRSLKVQYTSLPPQLVVWRALRAKHLLLSAVCIVAVSTNVLAVALSALLVEGLTTTEIPYQSTTMFVPYFNLTYGSQGAFNLGDGYYGNAVSLSTHLSMC